MIYELIVPSRGTVLWRTPHYHNFDQFCKGCQDTEKELCKETANDIEVRMRSNRDKYYYPPRSWNYAHTRSIFRTAHMPAYSRYCESGNSWVKQQLDKDYERSKATEAKGHVRLRNSDN